MVKNSKISTKNIIYIVIIVIIIIFIIYLIHILFKKNEKYESFKITEHYKSSSYEIPVKDRPGGSYKQSCNPPIYFKGDEKTMGAECKGKYGNYYKSLIDLPCRKSNGISNCNGILKCGSC